MEKYGEDTSYQIGEVQFNPVDKTLIFNRYRSVKLSSRETLILSYMLENPNKAITLSEIMSQCLSHYQCEPVAIRKTIQILSAKLESADNIEYPYIDCYRFRCDYETKEKLSFFDLKRLKRWFNRSPQITKTLTPNSL